MSRFATPGAAHCGVWRCFKESKVGIPASLVRGAQPWCRRKDAPGALGHRDRLRICRPDPQRALEARPMLFASIFGSRRALFSTSRFLPHPRSLSHRGQVERNAFPRRSGVRTRRVEQMRQCGGGIVQLAASVAALVLTLASTSRSHKPTLCERRRSSEPL
jgi:hypothetical protein